jgi:hypothetical protein
MLVLLPLETRHVVIPEVLDSIKAQTGVGDIIIVECRTDGEYHSKGNHSPLRVKGEKTSRLLCRDRAFNSGEEYVVIQDRGYYHYTKFLHTDNFSSMLYYMKTHPHQGAVSIVYPRGDERDGHVDVGCMMWRVSVLNKITLDDWKKGCACWPTCEEIKNLGFDVGYLPGLIRVKKL